MAHMQSEQTDLIQSDLWIGVICTAVAVAALLAIPFQVAPSGWSQFANPRGAAFFPLWSGSLLLALSVGIVLRSLQSHAASKRSGSAVPLKVIYAGAVLGASGVAIFWLGFLVTAAALIALLCLIFGERRPLQVCLLAGLVPLAIEALFRGVLNVLLPTGFF
ncbi:MAG: tripartite tricarboxylate transporter TctB family protein [Paracoccaceae bacterium]|nr:tripartite tricarboxylate transporter TctB family protein [Paracoccaceae bacterium]